MLQKWFFIPLFSSLLLLTGCQKYYVAVSQQWVDARYLASTHVHTPDPRQDNPPIGQMLIMDWRIPKEILNQDPYIALRVIYWDYTEQVFTFPIHERMGWVTYKLFNAEYDKKDGILTYKAELVTKKGEVFRDWTHQLWVNLITLDE